jgi:osmotically-inducible protein OsmY
MSMFEKEIKLLVMAALRDNDFTRTQPIRVHVKGRNVMLSGAVASETHMLEAVITVESISEFLNVYTRLQVRELNTVATQVEAAVVAAV